MTSVTVHLLSAHLPLGGGLVLLALLTWALLRGGRTLWQATLAVIVLVALAAVISMTSGPSALVALEPWLDSAGEEIARDHETAGRIASYLWVAAAALAFVGLARMGESGLQSRGVRLALVLLVVLSVGLSLVAGASGGRIRHEELRAPVPTPGDLR